MDSGLTSYFVTSLSSNDNGQAIVDFNFYPGEAMKNNYGADILDKLGRSEFVFVLQKFSSPLTLKPAFTTFKIEGKCDTFVMAMEEEPETISVEGLAEPFDLKEMWSEYHAMYVEFRKQSEFVEPNRGGAICLRTEFDLDEQGEVRMRHRPLTTEQVYEVARDIGHPVDPSLLFDFNLGGEIRIVRNGFKDSSAVQGPYRISLNDIPSSVIIDGKDYADTWMETAVPHIESLNRGRLLLDSWKAISEAREPKQQT